MIVMWTEAIAAAPCPDEPWMQWREILTDIESNFTRSWLALRCRGTVLSLGCCRVFGIFSVARSVGHEWSEVG